jgi:protein-disulfide isomerase
MDIRIRSMVARWRVAAVCTAGLLAVMAGASYWPASAQAPSELQGIQQELAGLRQEIQDLRTMLQQAMGPRPVPAGAGGAGGAVPSAGTIKPLTLAGRPSKGSAKATVTLVEYADYECPFCGRYGTDVYPQIDRDYIKTNKVQYVFKNYPIAQLHPASFKAHVAAACAGDQRRYWEMHDKLYTDQRNFTLERFTEHAGMLKLDLPAFRACMDSGKHDALINADVAEAQGGGVQGTPVFVLALTDPNGKTVTPSRVLVGAQPYEAFKEAIDAMLAQAAAGTR